MTAIRVVHIPGRTPYARKLIGQGIQMLNETTVDELAVPQDATLAWLLDQRPWDWLDVVHLHHVDFEPLTRLRRVLVECGRAEKQVVFTAHDVNPVFGSRVAHHRMLRTMADANVPFVCLTPAAEAEVRWRFGARTIAIPHGYVSEPRTPLRPGPRGSGPTRFLVYGSLRSNRDIELLLACWRYARDLAGTTLRLVLPAPSRASLAEDEHVWRAIREHSADARLSVHVMPFPSDQDVNDAMASADCLVLPYRWASHSGQLEHAFDLGVLPVAARTGFLPQQVELHHELVDTPVWFDWSDGAAFDYGARLLDAMQRAHSMIQSGWHATGLEKFIEHRRHEHAEVIAAYRALYEEVS